MGKVLARGGNHAIRLCRNVHTNEEVAAKQHSDEASFLRERDNLQNVMQDRKGRRFVMELKHVDNHAMILYVEKADGSVKDKLDAEHGRMDSNVVKVHVTEILRILEYLHEDVGIAHNDIKAENMLVYVDDVLHLANDPLEDMKRFVRV